MAVGMCGATCEFLPAEVALRLRAGSAVARAMELLRQLDVGVQVDASVAVEDESPRARALEVAQYARESASVRRRRRGRHRVGRRHHGTGHTILCQPCEHPSVVVCLSVGLLLSGPAL